MNRQKQTGFTIVELLIVIVIIGILAAITIVAYNGIQNRGRIAAVSSSLSGAAKQLELSNVNNGTYPADTSGLQKSSDISYEYSTTGSTYCLTATKDTISYKISNTDTSPSQGGCAGHGTGGVAAITNIVTNPNFEASTTGWSSNGTNSIAPSTDFKFSGAKSLKIATTGTSNVGTNTQLTLEAGATYTFSGYIYLPSSFGSGLRMCVWGAPINNNALTCTSYISSTGSWQRLSYTGTATSAGTVRLYFYNGSGDALVGAVSYIDGILVTKSSNLYGFADGSTSNWIWNGTPDNATSTGPPV